MKLVTTKRLASAIGLTTQRVYSLRSSGILSSLHYPDGRRVRNQWSLWHSVAEYSKFKSESKYPGRPSVSERDDVGLQSVFDFV
jgi:hypothetical protein